MTRRMHLILGAAAVTGVMTGLIVAMFEWITADVLLRTTLGAPLLVQAMVPTAGLLVAAGCLRLAGRRTPPATSDEYIRAFHDPVHRLNLRAVVPRLLGAIGTLGAGAPLGYEGPGLYSGAAIGTAIHRRVSRLIGVEGLRVLLVAGAAAGVAAVFKAPVTGLVFALEVPFQDDLAHRMLLPAAISAATSYLVFAAIAGTAPLLPVAGQPPFNVVDLGGAAGLGLLVGGLARAFVAVVGRAKRLAASRRIVLRTVAAGAVLAATVLAGAALAGSDLVLGPGYEALRWALEPGRSIPALIALGTLRVVGTAAAIAGGGVGGLFIPLVIQGALCGRAVGVLVGGGAAGTLFPVVGMAAFLGAGYRVPLASVVFVAEFTGRPGFVVPGLIAAVAAQLIMGRASVSAYQVRGRVGHLETRLRLPLAAMVDTGTATVPPDATVDELFWQHLVGNRRQAVPVVDGSTYVGLVRAEDLPSVERADWPRVPVSRVMRSDVPVATTSWLLADAIRAMEEAETPILGVCDDGRFVGVISAQELVDLEEVLERASSAPDGASGTVNVLSRWRGRRGTPRDSR